MAIICYKCPLEDTNTTSLFQQGRLEGMCSSPTYSVDCSKDPQFGNQYDACQTVTVRLNVSYKYIKVTDCGAKAFCNVLTDMLCKNLKGKLSLNILECNGSCCEQNFCNGGSQPTNPSSTCVPPNTAILGILGVMVVVLANLNVH